MEEQAEAEDRLRQQGRLADLYRRYADDAARLAYVLTGQRELAEDLMQEAFVRLARRLVHLRDSDAAGPYLRRTVVNLANSHFRRRRLERAHMAKERFAQLGPNEARGPEADGGELRAALLALPIRQRTAIALRYLLDLPEREAAEVMGIRVGAVKALVHRGMESLRAVVRE